MAEGGLMMKSEAIFVLTPTGGRPEAFSVLTEWVNRQTLKEFAWLIIDDCEPATPAPWVREGIVMVKLKPKWVWQPGQNTQAANLTKLLTFVPEGAKVIVMEDDDWYAPNYLEKMATALDSCELAGVIPALYYNLKTGKIRDMGNKAHASLSATAMTGDALEYFRHLCKIGASRIDMKLWQREPNEKAWLIREEGVPPTIGIKGGKGRPGIGIGHRTDAGEVAELSEFVGAQDAALIVSHMAGTQDEDG